MITRCRINPADYLRSRTTTMSDELYIVYTTDSRISDHTTQSELVLVSLYQLSRYF